ncbi:hypothetical protein IWW36_002772 [Coemansia brasiliensis]|uniref:Uncharacterized protein n=1 Tax=Coemansia brasiliensis TaxID=2650707 RepID=A0A9W8IBC0_9FUNG|nr:hypothetical protein IWW36_002772 [Coemansia brasiliensis]
MATRLLEDYDARIEASRSKHSTINAKNTDRQDKISYLTLLDGLETDQPPTETLKTQPIVSGRNMPSSMMYQLNLKFYADIQRRRQRQGLRIQVLSKLSELRHMIQAHVNSPDQSGRVMMYLEELNNLYNDYLHHQAHSLWLRSANSTTLSAIEERSEVTVVMAAVSQQQQQQLIKQPVKFNAELAFGPLLNSKLYSKNMRKQTSKRLQAINPRNINWIDYLVEDLTEAEAHALFSLVARSKFSEQVQPKYRAAVEEALGFAFNRRGYVLHPIESLRVCMYFLRRMVSKKKQLANTQALLETWRHAGRWCARALRATRKSDDMAMSELLFMRWNNVASEAILWQAQHNLPDAIRLLAEWHVAWTHMMHILCPGGGRRSFLTGDNPAAYPYWRSKQPGRLRLHRMTLSTHTVNYLLQRMVCLGQMDNAVQLLGLATSEIGVPVRASMFNIVLGGLTKPPGLQTALHFSLERLLKPTNPHALCIYRTPTDEGPVAQMMALLSGMTRWGISPDQYTFDALLRFCCRADNHSLLRAVVVIFADRWQIQPTAHGWKMLQARGLHTQVREWVQNTECA